MIAPAQPGQKYQKYLLFERLIHLADLVHTRDEFTAAEVVEEFNSQVSACWCRRTLYRDLVTLSEMGWLTRIEGPPARFQVIPENFPSWG